MKKLDWIASSVIIVTILILSGVIFIGNQVPINISCRLPNPCTQVGPFGSVTFEFSRPIQSDEVEDLWQTTPPTEGKWEWLDNQHGRWYSLKSLPSSQKITLQFIPGQAGQNGELINNINQWEVMVRPPRIIVTRKVGDGQEIFTFGLEDGSFIKQLTQTNNRVFDYQASPDGESVVFSVMNDLKGIDLWIVQRDGSNQHKLLDCGADRCSTPTWSPTMQELAYTREGAELDQNEPNRAPRIWIFDVKSGQTAPLFADPQKIGYDPKWSPDGQWLSLWNGLQGGIQVVKRKTGETFLLESSNGDVGCWTPDSQFIYYSNIIAGEGHFRNVVLKADIGNRSISTFLGGNVEGEGESIDNPVCSPNEKWVVVSVQPNVNLPGKELLLFNPDVKDPKLIMDDLSRTPSYYSWTPDGDHLVFQSDLLGGNENDEEIWVWDRTTGSAKNIKNGGRSPQWLP